MSIRSSTQRRAEMGLLAKIRMEPPANLPSRLPVPSRWRRLTYFPWDAIQLRLARRKTGQEFLRYFIDLGGLKPDDAVLDVGCGRGRMAISLTQYLRRRGRYEGFDITSAHIDWCAEHVSRPYPNFRFALSDIFNAAYNPTGKTRASEYVFPYPDATFDLVFPTSPFSPSMLPGDLEHYVSEISRVTKKGGRCLATFFLLERRIAASSSRSAAAPRISATRSEPSEQPIPPRRKGPSRMRNSTSGSSFPDIPSACSNRSATAPGAAGKTT